jgi:hypothetical protein
VGFELDGELENVFTVTSKDADAELGLTSRTFP